MATPSTTDTDSGVDDAGQSVLSFFGDGLEVAGRRPVLALVPLVAALTAVGKFERAARADTTMQINFGLPSPVAGLWTFLNAPASGGVTVFGYAPGAVQRQPELLVQGLSFGAGALALLGVLTALYLGAIDDELAGRSTDHLDNLRQHAPVTLAFVALQFLGILALLAAGFLLSGLAVGAGGVTAGAAVLLVPAILGGFVGIYLLTPGVYVGVARDLGPVAAFRDGLSLALTADYLLFAVAHAGTVAAASVVLSAVGYSGGLASLLLVAVVAAPVGLVLNAATMAFVRDRLPLLAATAGGSDDGPTPAVRRVADGDG
jgi:hypothetical protein